MNKFLILILILAFASCKQKDSFNDVDEYLYHNNPRALERSDDLQKLDLNDVAGIDILWVIDNSGSMMTIQNNVIANTKIFMEQFAKQRYIKWKMGLISTDKSDRPRIGFDTKFDSTLVDVDDPTSIDGVVGQFQNAVNGLGVNGSASEYTFYNILRHFKIMMQKFHLFETTHI